MQNLYKMQIISLSRVMGISTLAATHSYSTLITEVGKGNTTSAKPKLKMCGWPIHCYGELEELQLSDKLKMPKIRYSRDCLVRVNSTTVNPIDVAMVRGYGASVLNAMRCHPGGIEFPLCLGREFCGELVQRGMGADSQLSVGDRVWGVVPLHLNGSHAEYVAVPDYCISSAPKELSSAEAASVLYAGLTAWSGIYLTGLLGGLCGTMTSCGGGAGKRVLVLGGSGSVGSLAIQILKSQQVQVLSTCNEDALELVKGIGADRVINYKNGNEMDSLQNYEPFDIILDCAGQGSDYVQTLNLKFRQYITFSSPLLRNIDNSGIGLGLLKNVADLVEKNAKALTTQGGVVKWGFFTPAPQGITFLKKLVESKKVLPIVDSQYTFKRLPEAYKKVASGHLRGKVVVNLEA